MSNAVLLLAQIDDAPGELLGHVLEQLDGLGAKNVQLLANIGKKGRPGYTLLVDIDADAEQEVAGLLAGELGIWGYRVLQSEHKHFEFRRATVELEVRRGGVTRAFSVRVKRVFNDGRFLRVKAEHDDLATICRELSRDGEPTYLAVLKSQVEAGLGADEPGGRLVLDLDGRATEDLSGAEPAAAARVIT
jgi:uncharacterized protein (DUF111 family)